MRRFLLKLLRRRRLDRDLQAELAFHRDRAADGRNPLPLGNAANIREQAFDLWRFNFIENLWRDLVYAARGLRRNPALVLTALVSLGLGIGVNTAMFSLGVGFLLSEPSVRDAGSLVSAQVAGDSNSPEKAVDFIRASGLFQDVAGENEESFANFNDGSDTTRVFAVYTTKNYFTALGVPMVYGRGVLPSDPDEVAVLNNDFWRKRFGGDPSAVGRTVNLDGRICTIVGILPESHRTLIGFGFSPDLYLPRYLESTTLAMYARLKPGMSLAEARAGLVTVAKRMDESMPERWKYADGVGVLPIAGYARPRGQPEMVTVSVFFAMLLAVVGLVLLIACVNVASLLLARASARRREFAIRLALGAGRGRLMQQFMAESLLLSLLGAGFGLALAQITATLLAAVQLPLPLPLRFRVAPDWRVAAYAAILTTFAVFACGMLPALQCLKESIATDLHREAKMRLRRTLVAAQIATSVVVLATGFLFLRNLMEGAALSPGFDLRRTLRADVYLPPAGFSDPQKKTAYVNRVLAGVYKISASFVANHSC
jgi:predicted permease